MQHLHLAGVHPEPCQNHSAGVWAAVAAGSDLLFSAQLAGSQAAGNGGFRAGCAGRGADRTAAYGGLCRGTGRKAEPDQCAAASAERTAGPAGRCPHPVDRRGQPRCAHPAGADPGLGGAAGAGRRPAGNCPAKGRRHPHPERKTPHPDRGPEPDQQAGIWNTAPAQAGICGGAAVPGAGGAVLRKSAGGDL